MLNSRDTEVAEIVQGRKAQPDNRWVPRPKESKGMPQGLIDWDLAVARGQRMREAKRIFVTAEWRDLAMLNYEGQPASLAGYVPPGTTLDSFEGKTYVSLVGC